MQLFELNYKKIWKAETIVDKILAFIIGTKRDIESKIYHFKKHCWYRLLNRIHIIGIPKRDKVFIVLLRQQYKEKSKNISKYLGIDQKKVLAVLYYYNCWKIKDWKDLFMMNITRDNCYFRYPEVRWYEQKGT